MSSPVVVLYRCKLMPMQAQHNMERAGEAECVGEEGLGAGVQEFWLSRMIEVVRPIAFLVLILSWICLFHF